MGDPPPLYVYEARLLRVVSGSSLDAIVDHGFGVFTSHSLDLAGVVAPSKGEPGFEEIQRALCMALASSGNTFVIRVLGRSNRSGAWSVALWTIEGAYVNEAIAEFVAEFVADASWEQGMASQVGNPGPALLLDMLEMRSRDA